MDEFKKFFKPYDIIIAHNYVHHPNFLHVSNIPEEMKTEICENIKDLRQDEIDRLKTELYKEKDDGDILKFYEFIKLLDSSRNVNIVNYLNEWEKYFKND